MRESTTITTGAQPFVSIKEGDWLNLSGGAEKRVRVTRVERHTLTIRDMLWYERVWWFLSRERKWFWQD